ncbi:MAG: MATE family efflux transporter [Fusobacteriaceae bacterium]|jgi:putative MATE family efflux protein|nr:MATE family efflux transporter [Fusobacteriaceae bacterium]
MFTNASLKKLLFPLIVEQFLALGVGLADIMMVASAGEEAVSGVSLVDTLVILIMGVFTAMATGGAVVASQYLGFGDRKKARVGANQLVLVCFAFSIFFALVSFGLNGPILRLIYGDLHPTVAANARIYFYIIAASFPFLGGYNAGAAIFRAQGNSKITMVISFIMNLINIAGNYTLIFIIPMGVAGAAVSSLVSRAIACVVTLWLARNPALKISIHRKFKLGFDWSMIRKILYIGVPTGLENSIFQLGKVIVARLITSFGVSAIAANGISSPISAVEVIPGMAIGVGLITVVGQCIGAKKYNEARFFTFKLMKICIVVETCLNLLLILFMKRILALCNLTDETLRTAYILTTMHSVFSMFLWPLSFCLPNALRASNDATFTMKISILSMFLFRVAGSFVLGRYFGLGVVGVWISMMIDWAFRSSFFIHRFFKRKLVPRVSLVE